MLQGAPSADAAPAFMSVPPSPEAMLTSSRVLLDRQRIRMGEGLGVQLNAEPTIDVSANTTLLVTNRGEMGAAQDQRPSGYVVQLRDGELPYGVAGTVQVSAVLGRESGELLIVSGGTRPALLVQTNAGKGMESVYMRTGSRLKIKMAGVQDIMMYCKATDKDDKKDVVGIKFTKNDLNFPGGGLKAEVTELPFEMYRAVGAATRKSVKPRSS